MNFIFVFCDFNVKPFQWSKFCPFNSYAAKLGIVLPLKCGIYFIQPRKVATAA